MAVLLLLCFIDTQTYLLTDQFIIDNYLWQFYGISFKPRGVKIFIRSGFTSHFEHS